MNLFKEMAFILSICFITMGLLYLVSISILNSIETKIIDKVEECNNN